MSFVGDVPKSFWASGGGISSDLHLVLNGVSGLCKWRLGKEEAGCGAF